MSAISIEVIERSLGIKEAEQQKAPSNIAQRQITDPSYENLLRRLKHIRRMVEIKEERIGGLVGVWRERWEDELSDYKSRMSDQLIDENPWLVDVLNSIEKRQGG